MPDLNLTRKKTTSTRQWIIIQLAIMSLVLSPPLTGNIQLPAIGDSDTTSISLQEEEILGQAWLKSLRATLPTNKDPIVFEYLENLLYRLVSHTDFEDKTLDLLLIENNTLNAFAAPGGIVGIYTGLLDAAENESQLASVITHELAHLSQRHFSRRTDSSKQASLLSLLGTLAAVTLAASGGSPEATTALLLSGQAAAIENQLRYSRNHEREADRIGIQTLIDAGYQPQGASQMFTVMQNKSSGNDIPEFLLTHPVTQSRIAEAKLREQKTAREFKQNNKVVPIKSDSLDFQLIKARLFVQNAKTAKEAIRHFQHKLKPTPSNSTNTDALLYGLALAQLNDNQLTAARKTLLPLTQQVPGKILYSLLDIEIDLKSGDKALTERRLRDLYSLNPNNYSISMRLAKVLSDNNQAQQAAIVLNYLSRLYPKQPDVWYHLAEANGQAKKLLDLHRARAEFYFLNGKYKQAFFHLEQADRFTQDNAKASAQLRQRNKEFVAIRRQERQLGISLN